MPVDLVEFFNAESIAFETLQPICQLLGSRCTDNASVAVPVMVARSDYANMGAAMQSAMAVKILFSVTFNP
jgi:hypothetical protein